MSVYLPKGCKTWRYRFHWRGRRHCGTTGQLRRDDAELVDKQTQLRVRQSAYGIAPFDPAKSPRFSDWAEIYFHDVTTRRRTRIKRPERIDHLLRVVLRFWGRRPTNPGRRDVGGPFHDLRLVDPIAEPQWILRFERWIDGRGLSGQSKNQYRSVLSQMYRLAAAPAWTAITGVSSNPFRELERDPKVTRTVTLSLEQLRQILAAASYHVRLAIAIGLLAHKLRRDNILKLTWKDSVSDFGPRTLESGQVCYGWITIPEDESKNGRPLVVPISKQLYQILLDAKRRSESSPFPSAYIVSYRGKPLKDVREGLRAVCQRVGVPYGRTGGGITFHTLRHTGSTVLAELDLSEAKRRQASGHSSATALAGYTHLRPMQEIETREQLSAVFPISDLVTGR